MRRYLLFALLPGLCDTFIIQRVEGPEGTPITHASVAGGSHIFLMGTNLGSPFNPPMVFLGSVARCDVQAFTSTKNRLHCIVNPHRLPPITDEYDGTGESAVPREVAGEFREKGYAGERHLPLRVFKGTRLAQCWHDIGPNKNCCKPPCTMACRG